MGFGKTEVILHPFGQGNLKSDGIQYSPEVTNATTGFTAVQTATLDLPGLDNIMEMEYGLTFSVKTATAASVLYKWQGSDDGTTWVDVCTAQTATADLAFQNALTVSGRFPLTTTGFLGKGRGNKSPFYLRAVSAVATSTTVTVTSRIKNSSYVKIIYQGF